MKKIYTAPSLTIVTVQVEHGYALSPKSGTPDAFMPSRDDLSEARSVSTGWVKDNDDAFWGDNTYSTEI